MEEIKNEHNKIEKEKEQKLEKIQKALIKQEKNI